MRTGAASFGGGCAGGREHDAARHAATQTQRLLRHYLGSWTWLPSPAYASLTLMTLSPLNVTKVILPGAVPVDPVLQFETVFGLARLVQGLPIASTTCS